MRPLHIATPILLLILAALFLGCAQARTPVTSPSGNAGPAATAAGQTPASGVPTTPATSAQVPAATLADRSDASGVPAGPAPMVETVLAVPAPFRTGVFAQERRLQIRQGFRIAVYARVAGARSMAVAPWGELLVTQPAMGRIVALSDSNGDGAADAQRPLLEGLQCPYGMVFRDGFLYVAQSTRVERFRHDNFGVLGPAEAVLAGLPQSACGPHHYRPLAIDREGNLYVAFGSSCNVCIEADPRRGTVWRYTPDGQGQEYARGLRNVVDLAFHPQTGQLWGVTNERDHSGDDIPPEPIGPIEQGANYGWPFCFWDGSRWVVDTRVPAQNPGCTGLTRYNGIQAHTAPLGLTFYTAAQFPTHYRGGAFIGLHGSWNRSIGVGYKVIYVPSNNGAPREAEDFVSGWLTGPRGPADSWGRPVDVAVAPDGALFISDDAAGAVYRVTYIASS